MNGFVLGMIQNLIPRHHRRRSNEAIELLPWNDAAKWLYGAF